MQIIFRCALLKSSCISAYQTYRGDCCVWTHLTGEDDINWDVFARHLDEVEVYGTNGVERRAKTEGFAVVRLYQQAKG